MAKKIKKGDIVIVLTGRDKGKQGKILSMKEDKVKIEGVQIVKKTVKPNPQLQKPGGIVEKEAYIHISNVAIYNQAAQKADKVRFNTQENGKKIRVYKSNGELIEIG